MQTIEYKKDNQFVGFLVSPEEGDYVSSEKLQTLLGYIKNVYSMQSSDNLDNNYASMIDNLKVNENGFIIDNINECNDITSYDLVKWLQRMFTEKIIVTQNMGNGPSIRHRVLYFGLKNDFNIEVKFTELGEFNSIDVALGNIANIYNL